MARPMTEGEMQRTVGGEAITLSGILAIMAIAVMTVVAYKLFTSGGQRQAQVKLPGGFSFVW